MVIQQIMSQLTGLLVSALEMQEARINTGLLVYEIGIYNMRERKLFYGYLFTSSVSQAILSVLDKSDGRRPR